MTGSPPAELPVQLREAVLAEIDPGEKLLWMGQPLRSRFIRMNMSSVWTLLCVFGVFAFIFLWLLSPETRRAAYGDQVVMRGGISTSGQIIGSAIIVTVVAALVGVAGVVAGAAARRTSYVVTSTRIFRLRLNRHGRVRLYAIEPGHPLGISRIDIGDGRGDVLLYPASQVAGARCSLSLIGVADARVVERHIRATFDP